MIQKRAIIIGTSGTLGLLLIYFSVLSLLNSVNGAIAEFSKVWVWILLLAFGFGLQLGLFAYIKLSVQEKLIAATAEVATSGTISTGSMIACCAHYLTNLLPILGVSALTVFLTRYQLPLLLLGVCSNLIGITIMLGLMQKYQLVPQNTFASYVFKYPMQTVRNVLLVLSALVIIGSFILTTTQTNNIVAAMDKETTNTDPIDINLTNTETTDTNVTGQNTEVMQTDNVAPFVLSAQNNDQNMVSVEVKPQELHFGETVKFDIAFNTHSVALDFDPATISILESNTGDRYMPLSWEGSPPGGHHRSGTLTFPILVNETTSIKLTLKNIANVPERTFEWLLEN